MMNANIFRVLQTSAAYFVNVSVTHPHLLRYTIYAGLVVKEPTLPSSPSVQNIIEEIPAFTDLGTKDLIDVMVLPSWNYAMKPRGYFKRRLKGRGFLNE
jgi:hypothetical protein